MLGTAGNISERAGELVAVTPTGATLETLAPGDITIVDLGAHSDTDRSS